eukprot:SM000248S08308  [mRNA]  locus=s248:45596:46424:+ [translate_table: standard]
MRLPKLWRCYQAAALAVLAATPLLLLLPGLQPLPKLASLLSLLPIRLFASPVWHQGAPWQPAVGAWLASAAAQPPASAAAVYERIFSKACLGSGDCGGVGVCNRELGACRCPLGYKGVACEEKDEYPCNLPATAVGPVGRVGPVGPWIVSMCPTHCDTETAHCVCGLGSNFPDRPVNNRCGFDET